MRKIYRVEHITNGLGPYSQKKESEFFHHEMVEDHSSGRSHPSLSQDFSINNISYLIKNFIFGFTSQEKLLDWFGVYFEDLIKMGFQVKVYEVKSEDIIYSKSGKQCMFRKPNNIVP